jgi:hypothetical protein
LFTAPDGLLYDLQVSIMTFDNNPGGKTGTIVYDPKKCWHGYTLLSSLVPRTDTLYFTRLIDMEGNIVKEWPLFPFPAKMLPGGHILGGNPTGGLPNHPEMGALVQMDWCGNPVWQWVHPGNPGGARQHHDYEREGNPVGYFAPGLTPLTLGGKTLILAHYNPPLSDTSHISDLPLEDDAIYEVDWAGNVLWEWHAWEHFEQMGFDDVAKEAIRTIQVGAPENIGGGFPETDWQHINATSYLGPNKWYDKGDLRFHPDNIIWDGRSSNIIAIIARHDQKHGKWKCKSGDIVWKIGPNYSPGTEEHKLGQIIGQHMAHMIPQGLPGAGNILLFDNGGLAGFGSLYPGLPAFWPNTYRNYSRVIEFDPRTLEIVWEYENKTPPTPPDTTPRKFFSWFISGAQRLPNGNTLITEGSTGRVFELTRHGEMVWEYINPYSAAGFGRAVYRAYRVPSSWVPENE